MDRRTRIKSRQLRATVMAACIACPWPALAQTAPATAATEASAIALSLRQVFDAAWARQPEALALRARRDAARAQRQAAQSWTPEPAALEVSNKTDRLNRNVGVRELEVGVAVPLWLPGERSRRAAFADAESAAVESRATAAQLRVAATVREAWWQWQRARIEADNARDQLDNTRRIAADVARRTKAGDLARADQHQADGAVAAAESGLNQADAGLVAAQQQLRALAGHADPARHLPHARDVLAFRPQAGRSADGRQGRRGALNTPLFTSTTPERIPMKTQTLMASIALALAGSAFAAGDHHHAGDDHKPMHGGIVVATKIMDYELVAKPTTIHLYLHDHGKAADVSKASAKVTLLSGTEKQEVELKPAGNRLEATGTFKVGPGTKVVALVTIAGNPAGAVRFALK